MRLNGKNAMLRVENAAQLHRQTNIEYFKSSLYFGFIRIILYYCVLFLKWMFELRKNKSCWIFIHSSLGCEMVKLASVSLSLTPFFRCALYEFMLLFYFVFDNRNMQRFFIRTISLFSVNWCRNNIHKACDTHVPLATFCAATISGRVYRHFVLCSSRCCCCIFFLCTLHCSRFLLLTFKSKSCMRAWLALTTYVNNKPVFRRNKMKWNEQKKNERETNGQRIGKKPDHFRSANDCPTRSNRKSS